MSTRDRAARRRHCRINSELAIRGATREHYAWHVESKAIATRCWPPAHEVIRALGLDHWANLDWQTYLSSRTIARDETSPPARAEISTAT